MVKNISWHSYVTIIVVLIIVYYIVIGILYFRHDILRIVKTGFPKKDRTAPLPAPEGLGAQFSSVHELMDELNHLFINASNQGYPKEELTTVLHSKMQDYTHLKATQFEPAINTHIIQTASSMCNCELDDTDIKRIW